MLESSVPSQAPPPPRKRKPSHEELLAAAKKGGFNYLSSKDCPDLERLHAKGLPKDLNPTTGLSKTHKQGRCPTCGYWSLWTARKPISLDGQAAPEEAQ